MSLSLCDFIQFQDWVLFTIFFNFFFISGVFFAMKRAMPWSDQVDLISSDESSSDAEGEVNDGTSNSTDQPPQELSPEGTLKNSCSFCFC